MIADLKLGAVNSMCASLPTYFRPGVDALRSVAFVEGYDATSDFKDHFHTWLLHPHDRPFVHVTPPTGPDTFATSLRYASWPMGSVNAPHASNSLTYGNQEDTLRELAPFAGTDICNDPSSPSFDASLPSIFRRSPTGTPSATISTHMDDSIIGGASYGHSWHALAVHVKTASRKGIRISWEKLSMPRQAGATYSGFECRRGRLAATSSTPTSPFLELAIRQPVVDDIRALIAVARSPAPVPRLTLARLAGKLQSNAPILKSLCPFLRKLYDAYVFGDQSQHFWASAVPVLDITRANLEMIDDILSSGRGRLRVHGDRTSLALQWTDGSGSGTGGCAYLVDLGSFSTWSADWVPSFRHFSSNMKELMSVEVAVRRQFRVYRKYGNCLLARRLVLHYTDNAVTAGILRQGSSTDPNLLKVARSIILMCSEMDTEFIVVHVSGKRMIEQGTDGLSRDAKTGTVAPDHWRLALLPISMPEKTALWQEVLELMLGTPLFLRPQSSAPSDIAGTHSLFFASPWVAAALASNILIAQNMDLRTLAAVVIPRRCQQLFTRAFRRFTLLTIPAGGPLWGEHELEPLCVYILPVYSPPPPLADRYLSKHAIHHRHLISSARSKHLAAIAERSQQQQEFIRSLQLLPDDVSTSVLLDHASTCLPNSSSPSEKVQTDSKLPLSVQTAMTIDWLPRECHPPASSSHFIPASWFSRFLPS